MPFLKWKCNISEQKLSYKEKIYNKFTFQIVLPSSVAGHTEFVQILNYYMLLNTDPGLWYFLHKNFCTKDAP
jgi:hypothetical protein